MQIHLAHTAERGVRSLQSAQRGVTLVEACVVFAVLAIVAIQVVPNLRSFIDGRRLEGAATRLATDLHYIRTEAVARNQRLRLTVQTTATGGCYMVHTGEANACTCRGNDGADSTTGNGNATARCSAGAQIFKSVWFAAADRISLDAQAASTVFDPVHGTASPSNTFRLIASDQRAIHEVVNIMGRVRSCSPAATMPGHGTC